MKKIITLILLVLGINSFAQDTLHYEDFETTTIAYPLWSVSGSNLNPLCNTTMWHLQDYSGSGLSKMIEGVAHDSVCTIRIIRRDTIGTGMGTKLRFRASSHYEGNILLTVEVGSIITEDITYYDLEIEPDFGNLQDIVIDISEYDNDSVSYGFTFKGIKYNNGTYDGYSFGIDDIAIVSNAVVNPLIWHSQSTTLIQENGQLDATVSVDANGATMEKVEFYVDNALYYTDYVYPYQVSVNSPSDDFDWYAVAVASEGKDTTDVFSVAVNKTPIINSLIIEADNTPITGTIYTDQEVLMDLLAFDGDGDALTLEIYDNGFLIGTETANSLNGYNFSLAEGAHSIYVRVSDGNGGIYSSANFDFNVEAPVINGIGDDIINKMSIYPNPAADVITVESIEFTIVDSNGQNLGRYFNTADVSDFVTGTYFVVTELGVHRFVKF